MHQCLQSAIASNLDICQNSSFSRRLRYCYKSLYSGGDRIAQGSKCDRI
ncbi:hypothetical protein [Microseira sp. BLCC-F43]